VGLALLHRGGLSCRKKEKRICDFSTAVRLSPELSLVGHGENINGRVDQNGQNVFAFADFEDVLTDHSLRCQGFVFSQCSQFDHPVDDRINDDNVAMTDCNNGADKWMLTPLCRLFVSSRWMMVSKQLV